MRRVRQRRFRYTSRKFMPKSSRNRASARFKLTPPEPYTARGAAPGRKSRAYRTGSGGRDEQAMPSKPPNRSLHLHAAKATKQDEFYTQLSDIENELRHYTAHFKNQMVLCNCDDPKVSNFFHYFSHNFEKLKLKKLITTCY